MHQSSYEPPRPLLPAQAESWPLHGAAAALQAERAAAAALPPHLLMQRAARAVARLALAVAPHAHRIWVAAGPGNNGGDGLWAAALLRAAGKDVRASLLGDEAQLPDDAAHARGLAVQAGVPLSAAPAPPFEPELVIDALLGVGGGRAPEGALAQAVLAVNGAAAPVLAVDLPSGLDAEHGRLFGEHAVHADHTLSLLSLKPGLFTGAGRDHAGRVWLDPLGVEPGAPDAWLAGAELLSPFSVPRQHAQHKGSFGEVVVVGGAPGMAGAAALAGRASLCAGAGRVVIDTLDPDAPPSWAELMVRPGIAGAGGPALEHATVVCGCGGGDAVVDRLQPVLTQARRLVLDADALNALAANVSTQALLAARLLDGRFTVLTPHPLEAARLLGTDIASVQRDRLQAAQILAERLQCVVLLKGSGSVTAAPGRKPWINPTGNALLATAGTGDVLAGWLGGRWSAAPMGPDGLGSAQQLAAAVAYEHGEAADRAAQRGQRLPLTAAALIHEMAQARRA